MCAAPVGNQFWKLRTKHGRDRLYENPEDLWTACVEYFEWAEANPLVEYKASVYQGEVIQMAIPKMRALSITGLCNYLDISQDSWRAWRDKEDLVGVITRAEEIIYQQKFEGAAADLLNANIIARDLGLADRTNTDLTTKGESLNKPIEQLSDEELEAIIAKG